MKSRPALDTHLAHGGLEGVRERGLDRPGRQERPGEQENQDRGEGSSHKGSGIVG